MQDAEHRGDGDFLRGRSRGLDIAKARSLEPGRNGT
jgi:hypothetical protein